MNCISEHFDHLKRLVEENEGAYCLERDRLIEEYLQSQAMLWMP